MQTVARPCEVCCRKIAVAGEGTWCAACDSIFHLGCIAQLQDVCPKCRRRRVHPEDLQVFAQLCTECLTMHEAAAARCRACGSSMTYPSRDSYERRVDEVRRHARRNLVLGAAILAGGLLLIAAFSVLLMGFLVTDYMVVSGALLVSGMTVTVVGWRKLQVGRRLARFR